MKQAQWKYFESVNAADIAAAFQEWRKLRPGLGILGLVCEHEQGAVAELQKAANMAALPLAGAVVPGLIAEGGFRRRGVLLIAPLQRDGKGTDNSAVTELAVLPDALAPAPVFGALSLGEVGNSHGHGYPHFHNATIVGLPWP